MKPNIMLLVAEDTGRHHGCYGDPVGRTPAIDHLAAQGARYTQACSTAPVCAPARSSLVTGRYPWALGTHHMRSTLLRPPQLFTEALREAGYFVNWANKTDFNFEPPVSFADERSEWFDALASGSLNGRPWFLYHNFGVTHESSIWPETWSTEVAPRLPAEQQDPSRVPVPSYLPDTPEVRADLARYYDALAVQDQQVGRALAALEASGEAENTLVIYLSDHGRGLPREKRWCYGAGVHLPLIVRWPGKIAPGSVNEELVNWVDLAPTFLSVAGAPPDPAHHGRDFLGANAAATPPRACCFAGRDRMDEAFDRVRAAYDGRFHYIRNDFPDLPYAQRVTYMERQATTMVLRQRGADGQLPPAAQAWLARRKPAEELYDAAEDPDMVNNLAADPGHATTLARLRSALEENLARFGDLGRRSERSLIDQGLVADRLPEYAARLEPLPEHLQIGNRLTTLEMPEPATERYKQSPSALPSGEAPRKPDAR
jgi:N-sulfoglucosamine sulfohydrolase